MGRVCLWICACLLPIVLIGNAGAQGNKCEKQTCVPFGYYPYQPILEGNIRYRWEMETRVNALFLNAMGLEDVGKEYERQMNENQKIFLPKRKEANNE